MSAPTGKTVSNIPPISRPLLDSPFWQKLRGLSSPVTIITIIAAEAVDVVDEVFGPKAPEPKPVKQRTAQDFGITPIGEGKTLPEKRRDRDDVKWTLRSAQTQRSILQ